jgi:hypothetical protein
MRIETIVTKQGHPVPNKVTQPRGPFPPELLAQPKVVYEYDRQDDLQGVPIEGTAQNDFKPTRWFKCNDCLTVISEAQIEVHTCEG